MTTRRGPIFGLQADTNCIALILDPRNEGRPVEEVEDPFVVVDQSGIFARVLLAGVQTTDGRSIPVAVKIQKDRPAPPPVHGFGCSYTNRDAADAFASEARCLAELGSDGEGIIPPPPEGDPPPAPVTFEPCGRFVLRLDSHAFDDLWLVMDWSAE